MEMDLDDRLKKFALRTIRLYSALPKSGPALVLGKQLLRSGTSQGHTTGKHEEQSLTPTLLVRLRLVCRNWMRRSIG